MKSKLLKVISAGVVLFLTVGIFPPFLFMDLGVMERPVLSPRTGLSSNRFSFSESTSARSVLARPVLAADSGGVVINELMWMGSSGGSGDEWLELRNTTDTEIDIGGWQLTKRKTNGDEGLMIETPSGEGILANGFYLISEYDEAHSRIKVTPDLVAGAGDTDGSTFALANNDLQVKLYDGVWDSGGTVIDTADDGVGSPAAGDKDSYYSMERGSAPGDGTESFSWCTCEDSNSTELHWDTGAMERGTPRAQNSTCGAPATPTPTPTPTPAAIIPTPTPTPVPSPTPMPIAVGPGNVVINEIAWMGTSVSSSDEWLELYNNTGSDLDLSGWVLKSADGSLEVPLFGSVLGGGYYLLERTNDEVIREVVADLLYTGSLGNGGEHLKLLDSTGQLVDEVDCSEGWFAGDNETKSSMERILPSGAGSDPANWDTNNGFSTNGEDSDGNPVFGTPRAKNSVYGKEKGEDSQRVAGIDFEVPDEVVAGESFEVSLSLENFDPSADYRVKFLAGSDGEKFYDAKTLSDDGGKYLAWNSAWSGFPEFETDAAGAAEFEFEALIKDDAETGDYEAKIRVRNEETGESTDSGVKELAVEEPDESESVDDGNEDQVLGAAVPAQLPATGPSQDFLVLLGRVFLCLGLVLRLLLLV